MDLSPRQVAVVALLALVPVGIYIAAAGELTTVAAAIAVVNVCLIAGSVILLFGDAPADSRPATH
jgi:uncharacterized membrane protein